MNIGFLIDHRRCIGCHACSVACKEEHQVPLGVYRTWVKYVEKGEFPHTRRHFAVLRCNHCANAPCVTICPVTALYKRPDGIVDFDPAVCIGCKACMQACPYDALYLDPQQGTAAKCNFCAHRIDAGLRPACEIVCPTQAILSGDLDDPDSLIARVVARAPVQVRKPEKGTRPQLFYIDADAHSLTPAAVQPQPPLGMWSQLPPRHTPDLTLPGLAALPVAPPLEDLAPAAPRTVYDVAHAVPWGRKVSLYIWSKSIAAGALLLAALGVALGRVPDSPLLSWGSLLLALVFLALTGALLIFDLKRPERFYTLFLRPQWRSWLAIGAFVLLAYGAVLGLSLLAALLGATGLRRALLWPGGLLAILAAIYTGFLFGQAKGRDFWLSPALPLHLLVQALLAGAAAPGGARPGGGRQSSHGALAARRAAVEPARRLVHHPGGRAGDAPRQRGRPACRAPAAARRLLPAFLGSGGGPGARRAAAALVAGAGRTGRRIGAGRAAGPARLAGLRAPVAAGRPGAAAELIERSALLCPRGLPLLARWPVFPRRSAGTTGRSSIRRLGRAK
ncbi:MAG: hypothetical protein KatS3mg131_3075 [Candidatus Tectimicrobiota bacterium]|nr:MAG: hypothetical protein KatS3mg131_3075 [Candidatus Tectomicrobia bacterium]